MQSRRLGGPLCYMQSYRTASLASSSGDVFDCFREYCRMTLESLASRVIEQLSPQRQHEAKTNTLLDYCTQSKRSQQLLRLRAKEYEPLMIVVFGLVVLGTIDPWLN